MGDRLSEIEARLTDALVENRVLRLEAKLREATPDERVAAAEEADDAVPWESIEHVHSHYVCAMVNWTIALDELVEAREALAKERACNDKIIRLVVNMDDFPDGPAMRDEMNRLRDVEQQLIEARRQALSLAEQLARHGGIDDAG